MSTVSSHIALAALTLGVSFSAWADGWASPGGSKLRIYHGAGGGAVAAQDRSHQMCIKQCYMNQDIQNLIASCNRMSNGTEKNQCDDHLHEELSTCTAHCK